MKKLIIEPNTSPLSGSVQISGAKNSALPILCASILTDSQCTIKNVPYLYDIQATTYLLKHLGAQVQLDSPHSITIDSSSIKQTYIPQKTNLSIQARTSILMLGPLLAKYGKAHISLPKGCAIGKRPINLHIESLSKLGAKIHIKDGYIKATAPPKGLHGASYHFKISSVNATENLIMAATLAKGKTIITNAAIEPEISDLI